MCGNAVVPRIANKLEGTRGHPALMMQGQGPARAARELPSPSLVNCGAFSKRKDPQPDADRQATWLGCVIVAHSEREGSFVGERRELTMIRQPILFHHRGFLAAEAWLAALQPWCPGGGRLAEHTGSPRRGRSGDQRRASRTPVRVGTEVGSGFGSADTWPGAAAAIA